MSVQSDVAGQLAPWISLLAVAVRNNPDGDIYDMLARPDTSGLLERALAQDQALAEAALQQAWPASDGSAYRVSLESDIQRAYTEAVAVLRKAAIGGFLQVAPAVFVPGVTTPGANPAAEAARRRAQEVARAAAAAAWYLGFRNQMTVDVARTRHRGEQALAGVPDGWLKKWACRKDAAGHPDHRVCDWCRRLDALPAIPVWQEFSYGGYAGRRQPPRVYLDLQCPPRHPRCRCRIILVRAGAAVPQTSNPAAPVLFVPAGFVRSMPEDRYQALRDFHAAALHELGQVLRRHRGEVGNR